MHRFRKKSDVKRGQIPGLSFQDGAEPHNFLPPVSDFRTSLILPDLSRRFSLLRSTSGDTVTLEDLRTKFAEQRARGTNLAITEEEEDMLLETLGRIRGKAIGGGGSGRQTPEKSQENIVDGGDSNAGGSDEHGGRLNKTGSISSSPGGRSAKRYSNNLFGSGRLRDYTYLRSVASSRNSAGSTRTTSLTPTEASLTPRATVSSIAESLRPVTPVESNGSLSMQSSPNDRGSAWSGTSSVSIAPNVTSFSPPPPQNYNEQAQLISAAEYRLQKTLGAAGLKRASMALEGAIKEIEDEVEEEIVMPRSTPIPRNHIEQQVQQNEAVRDSDGSTFSSIVEAGMAISPDKVQDGDMNTERGPSPVPLRILPGYIPGMPRPMTPRDFDSDEQRSHSTTPRATSPMHASFTMDASGTSLMSSQITSGLLRRESISSTARGSSRPTTPLFLQRSANATSTNGRHTPVDEGHRSGDSSINSSFDFDGPLNSSILGRRRPASPLAGPPFQPMAVSSRPTTPSNIIWAINPDGGSKSSQPSSPEGCHSRDDSWASEGALSSSDVHGAVVGANGGGERHHNNGGGVIRTLNSPADLPTIERGQVNPYPFTSGSAVLTMLPNGLSQQQQFSFSDSPNLELASTFLLSNRSHRSPTPTQNAPRSPTSPTFGGHDMSSKGSRRSSKQNTPSPFNFGPLPSLALNPRANSSRSSLESAGSSFHSWDGEKDKVLSLFSDIDPQPVWHDLRFSDKSSSTTPGEGTSNSTSPEDEWDPEEIIKRYAGLKKGDFFAVQDKLVGVAIAKAMNPEPRAASSLRRRRPSTSQSNYSTGGRDNRVASPPPPSSPISVVTPTAEQSTRALLNSLLDPPKFQMSPVPAILPSLSSSADKDSPAVPRSNRNLTQVLFGPEESTKETPNPVSAAPTATPTLIHPPSVSASSKAEEIVPLISSTHSVENLLIPSRTPAPANSRPSTSPSPYLLSRNPSTPRIPPQNSQEQADLVREVQQKAEAATLALRKRPSNSNLRGEGLAPSGSLSRKRIDTSQISTPRLVSASTSVDTIPLRTPSLLGSGNTGTSKIGSRFKKLRGTLRAKNTTAAEENTSYSADSRTPPATQTAHYDPERLKVPGSPSMSSATETGRFKVPVPSPPASAGPGLKGFMARFRTKRMTEVPTSLPSSTFEQQATPTPFSPLSPLSQRHFPTSPVQQYSPSQATSDSGYTSTTPRPDHHRPQFANVISNPPSIQQTQTSTEAQETNESDALQQLFAAANNLGLDQNALNDLLARSGSTSSRTLLVRNTSTATSSRQANLNDSLNTSILSVPPIQQPNLSSSSGSDHTATPAMFNSSLSDPSNGNIQSTEVEEPTVAEETVVRKPSSRKPDHLRRQKDTDNPINPIVRRTIIYASDSRVSTVDTNALMKKSSMRRRRASAQSVSNRSVHDRAPTPPPPKSPTAKRFSHDGSPPIPHLPHSMGQADNLLTVPSSSTVGSIEKSNSAAYDSLYELYGDSRVGSMMVDPSNPDSLQYGKGDPAESGTALEVVELANGETIWKIVNGLRDDDDESVYTGRASIASEYSTREGDALQVFVKEHGRTGSKGSNASFVSRKKGSGGKYRPDTQVYYSSSEQIGRLIESLSQGMDSGSFNFSPNRGQNRGPGHSASSSLSTNDMNWTVEERLDRMLGSIKRT